MKQIITILVLVGMAYVGSVHIVLFISKYYLRIVAFYKDMKTFFRSRKEGNRIIEIKIREPTKSATKLEAIPVITPVSEPVKQEAITTFTTDMGKEQGAETVADTTLDKISKEETSDNEVQGETLFISLNIEGKEYNSSDEVSAEELEVMGRTLSNTAASIADEIATAKTLYKLKDTPFMDEINAVVGKRIKGLFDNIVEQAPKIAKSGDYDYSRYIK